MRKFLLRMWDRLTARALERNAFNVYSAARLRATWQSARYFERHMPACPQLRTRQDLLRHALSLAAPGGLCLEFGVAAGHSINHIARHRAGPVHGFDSFAGLPQDWYGEYGKGHFAQPIPAVAANVELVVGDFAATLPAFLAGHDGAAAFIHVDCDLYDSTRTVLQALKPRIAAGTVIVFDEYWNYPGWRQHEFRAFQEFIAETGLSYRYCGLVPDRKAVCVCIA